MRRTGDKGQPSVHEEPLDSVRRCDGAHAGAPAGGACTAGGNTDGGGGGGRTENQVDPRAWTGIVYLYAPKYSRRGWRHSP